MSHFPPSFVDEVLARTDIVELIGRYVDLKKSGSNLMGLCPFHHEKSPSFSVSADKQLYYCFGCGKGGGAFQFLMEHDGYSFPEAVEYLAEKAGLEVPRESQADAGEESRRRKALELLAKASTIFARTLHAEQGKAALAYVQGRGLSDAIVRDYQLGYAPDGYGFMERCFGNDARMQAQLEKVGLLFKGERGYGDRFRARLMFPIRDRRGQVVGFGGRILGAGEPKYLNSPETPWFHKSDLLYGFSEHRDQIRKRKLLLVVEGYMDVLALAMHGLPIALAPLGTAIGESQIREILRLHESPVFCFDGDRAGRQAAWRALERMLPLLKAEQAPKFLYLPEGEDPDSLCRQEGGEAFAARIEREAKPVLETWLSGLKLLAGQGAEGRARMAKKADAMLASMTDAYLRQAWQQEVEAATGIRLQKQGRNAPPRELHSRSPAVPASGNLTKVQEKFIAALMQKPSRLQRLDGEAHHLFLDDTPVYRIYTRAFSIMKESEGKSVDLAGQLSREFPDETRIPKWVNQATVQDAEFDSLLLDMEANHIRRLQKQGGLGLEESMRVKRRLMQIEGEQRRLKMTLEETGA
ncbi:MAG TPA: DNA primase [Mariprofundaceae bacterium]|nr:DNA primase [Mariprofundaceae bacterium]